MAPKKGHPGRTEDPKTKIARELHDLANRCNKLLLRYDEYEKQTTEELPPQLREFATAGSAAFLMAYAWFDNAPNPVQVFGEELGWYEPTKQVSDWKAEQRRKAVGL